MENIEIRPEEQEHVERMVGTLCTIWSADECHDGSSSERKWLKHERKEAAEEFGPERAWELYRIAYYEAMKLH